jgi:hypothetical protein
VSRMNTAVACDADGCGAVVAWECACAPCSAEMAREGLRGIYHACDAHRDSIGLRHRGVRCTDAAWRPLVRVAPTVPTVGDARCVACHLARTTQVVTEDGTGLARLACPVHGAASPDTTTHASELIACVRDLLHAARAALALVPRCDDGDCFEPATHDVGFVAADREAHDGMIVHGRMCEAHAQAWTTTRPGRTHHAHDDHPERVASAEAAIERAARVIR